MFFAQSLKLLAIAVLLAGLAVTVQRWPQPQSLALIREVRICIGNQDADFKQGLPVRECPSLLSQADEQQQMLNAGAAGLASLVAAMFMWWMGAMLTTQTRLVEVVEALRRSPQ